MMPWNRKKQPPIRSLIGEGIVLKGSIEFTDGMRIDGEVHGDLTAGRDAASLLVVGANAKVVGKVNADHVIIVGEVVGPVMCTGLLELQPTARVSGDICYQLLEMHPGAVVEGELKPLKLSDKPPLMLAASNDA
ncbi:MAG: polymer-forming cytoskeletal protein [Rubrivivax sp.]|nr:polymer-forming cytoskeletal protein [Rubrivivax sp.]